MMSRVDLDRIQSQLKVAVQAHQMLVAKMKTDPEHVDFQRTLHELQSEIRSLSEQQKVTVHQLRQEILTLQNSSRNISSGVQQLSAANPPSQTGQQLTTNMPLATLDTLCHVIGEDIKDPDMQLTKATVLTGVCPLSTDTPDMKFSLDAVKENSSTVATGPNDEPELSVREDPCKIEFMSGLQLLTMNSLKDLESKRADHKRRLNFHGHFSYGQFEPENEVREDCCTVCRRSGELLMCDVCSLVYHLQCLDPPLTTVPVGLWSCPKCQSLSKLCGGKDDWPGTLALVHSYLTHKTAREEEKHKMRKQNDELVAERKYLEEKASQLADTLSQRLQRRNELTDSCSQAQQSYDTLRNFVLMFRTS